MGLAWLGTRGVALCALRGSRRPARAPLAGVAFWACLATASSTFGQPAAPQPQAPPASAAPPAAPAPPTPAAPAPALDASAEAPPQQPDPSLAVPSTPIEELDLEELLSRPVVTASGGRAEERALTAANVYEVSRDEIDAHGWTSVAEVLANVPGLHVIDDLVQPQLSVRGVSGGMVAGTRIVRIMINGVAIAFRPNLHTFLGVDLVPMAAVERIEVAKGPLSALYGENAFLATVNVITRTASGARGTELRGRANLVRAVGFGGSGLVVYGSEHWDILAALGSETADRSGLRVSQTFASQNPAISPYYAPFFADESRGDVSSPSSGFLQISGRSRRWGNLTVQGGWQRQDAMGEFQLASVLTHHSRRVIENLWSSARWERPIGERANLWASLGASQGGPGREDLQYVTGNLRYGYLRNFRYRALDAAAGAEVSPLQDFRIFAGVEAGLEDHQIPFYTKIYNAAEGVFQAGDREDLIGIDDVRYVTLRRAAAYLGASGAPIPPLRDLRLSANVRLDAYWASEGGGAVFEHFPPQGSWRAAAAYRWRRDLVTKVIVGQAFQNPSIDLLYALPGFGTINNLIGSRTLPNQPPLVPQRVSSAELVADATAFRHIVIGLGVYAQRVDDAIAFLQRGANVLPRNQGRIEGFGVELTARAEYSRFVAYLNGATQWSFLTDPGTGRQRVDSTPPSLYPGFQVMGGVTLRAPEARLMANLHVRWIGAAGASQSNIQRNNERYYSLAPYVQVDLVLGSMRLRPFGPETETRILAGVRNVLDERHSEPGFGGMDVPSLGRTWFVEVRQSL